MHRCRAFVLVLAALLCAAPASADEVLTPAQAIARAGETVTVQMRVQGAGTVAGDITLLFSEATPQHADAFFIRISPAVRDKFKEQDVQNVLRHFGGEVVRITGKVSIVTFDFGKRGLVELYDPRLIQIVDPEASQPLGEEILSLYKSGKLFQRAAYKDVRAAFSRRFEAAHPADIRIAYGEDREAFDTWLTANTDIKENFYTAISERFDDVPRALDLFKQIWKNYPEEMKSWSQLAIATAVTWDRDKGVYDYEQHQKRAQAILPVGMMGALDNFKYVIDNAARMPHPIAYYPWEFLVYVINHRTPIVERDWAFGFFQVASGRSQSWHKEVPYDYDLLKGETDKNAKSLSPKLSGKDYTLKNILTYGGVCAHQADFACRTAQSLGLPAVYCTGSSAYRENHAWWMFIHVTSAKKDELKFLVHTDGRFDGMDHFYTGNVLDAQTGKLILDRDLERRLWIAGTDRVGKRLSDLIMRAYPSVVQTLGLGTKDKIDYLDKCLQVCKYNEEAWRQFALLAKRGELKIDFKDNALGHLSMLQNTFANYPDFVWRHFGDFAEIVEPAERTKQYEGVLLRFQKAKRADLACDARLKLTDLLVGQSKQQAAFTGLALSVRQFPTEGRYVPKLLKKMEEMAANVKGGPTQLGQMYIDLVPGMILYYKSDTTVYFKKMAEQAKAYFEQTNATQMATLLDARIAQAKAAIGKKAAGAKGAGFGI
jgi:hypothetical protein